MMGLLNIIITVIAWLVARLAPAWVQAGASSLHAFVAVLLLGVVTYGVFAKDAAERENEKVQREFVAEILRFAAEQTAKADRQVAQADQKVAATIQEKEDLRRQLDQVTADRDGLSTQVAELGIVVSASTEEGKVMRARLADLEDRFAALSRKQAQTKLSYAPPIGFPAAPSPPHEPIPKAVPEQNTVVPPVAAATPLNPSPRIAVGANAVTEEIPFPFSFFFLSRRGSSQKRREHRTRFRTVLRRHVRGNLRRAGMSRVSRGCHGRVKPSHDG